MLVIFKRWRKNKRKIFSYVERFFKGVVGFSIIKFPDGYHTQPYYQKKIENGD